MDTRIGESHRARKALFANGLKTGRVSVQEIEQALPPGSMTDAERWLLYYSLRAAEIEVYDAKAPAAQAGPDAQSAP